MSKHDPIQMTGDPNWCDEKYKNPMKCKANNCPCASDILAKPRKCKHCGVDVLYGWMGSYCMSHQVEALFS